MSMSPSMPTNKIDPYAYTSGRWLRRDQLERSARHIQFDFEALCRRVIQLCPGATSVTSCDKKEGGFNRVFVFVTDTGQRLVAKLPFALAGPPKLTTLSEVATLQYLQNKTKIPTPKVLDWSDDASNFIKTEYIIMEHVEGVQLAHIWPEMTADQQIRCIGAIFQKIKEIGNITFPAYGSLYHTEAPLEVTNRVMLDQDFFVGPDCGAMYWDCHPGEPKYYHNTTPNQGPWIDLNTYCDGLIDAGVARVPPHSHPESRPRYQGQPSEHLSLLGSGRAVIKKMSEDPRIMAAATPTLLHPDLHTRNIFVSADDPTVITGIIDWQSASIAPAFWYSQDIPDFATYAPSPSGPSSPNSELCARAFDGCVQLLLPTLALPRSLDESLFRPFRYCYRTWKDGAVAFHHELIETSQHWAELGLPGICPFAHPNNEVLDLHQDHYRLFVVAHDLKRDLAALLNTATDGWVPAEDWETTLLAHKEMFASMLAAVLSYQDHNADEPIKSEDDLREIWPFDI